MTQMMLREALEEIEQSRALTELDRFKDKLKQSVAEQCDSLSSHFDKDSAAGVKSAIYALQFLKKLEARHAPIRRPIVGRLAWR